jgi:predicted RNA-binding Zn ribbon-like protein
MKRTAAARAAQRPEGWHFDAEDFIGGALCLDFVNTRIGATGTAADRLQSSCDWLNWNAQAGTATDHELRAAHRTAQQESAAAALAMERVREARDVLHRVLLARLDNRAPAKTDVALLATAIAAAQSARRLVFADARFSETWVSEEDSVERLLWPVMLSAQSLLLDGQSMLRLHRCPADDCGWMFLDTSKNRSRRWCSMRTCGNLAKAQRHYARLRRSRAPRRRAEQ